MVQMVDPGIAGNYDYYFSGDLVSTGGSIVFGNTLGAYGNIHITGNLTLSSATSVALNVDGQAAGQNDQFTVTGSTGINGASLTVTTDFQSPAPSNIYTILTSAGGLSGDWAQPITYLGYPAHYLEVNPGELEAQ
jgi:hypothetical protein